MHELTGHADLAGLVGDGQRDRVIAGHVINVGCIKSRQLIELRPRGRIAKIPLIPRGQRRSHAQVGTDRQAGLNGIHMNCLTGEDRVLVIQKLNMRRHGEQHARLKRVEVQQVRE